MEQLISDSVTILKEGSNIELAYGWMDIGDLICEKQRSNNILKGDQLHLVNKLITMIKKIKLTDSIVLYRGITKNFDPLIAGKQFNALSPNINTALTYGDNVIKVIVPKGSHAFYISAWESVNTLVEEQEEKEVLLLPGKFISYKKEDNYGYPLLEEEQIEFGASDIIDSFVYYHSCEMLGEIT